ncbi:MULTISPECIES: hypothetical protein [Geobacillus]|uniref:HNH endonuclease n=1 Tax=Geobacillus jurassicus TaxID=235932 RepID=A0ABV6GWR6_9BACL|nr:MULTISPECIES: hypothetical protein [Geobacillus]MDF9296409.1 hypothetical protein [Geobacillus stearothermophilus]
MKIYDEPLAISADQWLSMLNDRSVFHEEDVELIRTLYYFPDCRASGKELARVLNKASHSPFNAQIGRLGKRIVRKHPVCPNCHAMLHRGNLSIEELQRIVEARRTISVAHEPN